MLNDPAARFTAAQHRDLHEHNLSLVLHALRDKPASRTMLARQTGLTLTGIGRLVGTLIDLGLVTPLEPQTYRGTGRPAVGLGLSGSVVCFGVEITADDITLVELALSGEARLLQQIRIPHAPTPQDLATKVASLINVASKEATRTGRNVFGVGLAVPAFISYAEQVIRVSASLGWRGVRLADEIHQRLQPPLPVTMESRAKCHALAQADRTLWGRQGTLAHLEVDLTIGVGVVVDGAVQHSRTGTVGHIPLDPRGPVCQCGNVGCLEALAGLRRLADLAGLDLAAAGAAAAPLRDALVDQLAARAADGDARTLEALQTAGHWLGVGCVVTIHTLDAPNMISLGGYPPRLEQWILPHIRDAIDNLARNDYVSIHELTMAPDRSGIARGAAMMSLYALLRQPLSLTRPRR